MSPRPPDARGRILVVAGPHVGDTVLAVPFLRNLRAACPGHAIDLLAEGRVPADLLHACPYLDAILPWERPAKRPVAGLPAEVRGRGLLPALVNALDCGAALRSRRYERVYLLKRSPSAAVVAYRAGIPHRIGHADVISWPLLTRSVARHPGRHRVDAWLDLLASEGIGVDDGRLETWIDAAAAARVERLLESLPAGRSRVFLGVTASDWRRQWPLERWVEVVRRLVAECGCEIVLCGGEADRAANGVLRAAAPGHVHDLSNAVPLRDLAALVTRLDLFLGVESGLMHVSAACGVPTVALFDPRTLDAWRPRGPAHATICGTAASRRPRWLRRREPPPPRPVAWLAGAALAEVTVATVVERTRTVLPGRERPEVRRLDLRTGHHRYAVLGGPAVAPAAASAGG